jgi:hypothetical protein
LDWNPFLLILERGKVRNVEDVSMPLLARRCHRKTRKPNVPHKVTNNFNRWALASLLPLSEVESI